MTPSLIFCPGGPTSQSGAAVNERYPQAQIESCGKIPAVDEMLLTHDGPFVIPIWNSHEGEVSAARYFWDHVEDQKIKIEDAWGKIIDFWFVRRSGAPSSHGVIGSVLVAGTQCSGFLQRNGLCLERCDLTTVALEKYVNGAEWDGVLVAPGQGQQDGFEVVERTTANPNNFTTFVRIVPSRTFKPRLHKSPNYLTGVSMRAFGATLGDAESEFFERLLDRVNDASQLPKLIFVFNRDAKVGLLFEGAHLHAGDLLDAEQLEDDSIRVFETAGETASQYSLELSALFNRHFPSLTGSDFIKHHGVNSCMFACPPLGVYTHGYDATKVEPVVRFYISKLFGIWYDEQLRCSQEQFEFFERHQSAWLEQGSEFMRFETVNAT